MTEHRKQIAALREQAERDRLREAAAIARGDQAEAALRDEIARQKARCAVTPREDER